ncbi:helix-turn-helix domain-containing protein [Microbacterium sp. 179-I 3D2 NHS]|uniref:helix-turn-helix domain-containing protein n=1 Tax=Microbacterium sp. 179-I 3D2 NHS TaxID=3235178 RepID=UPI00399F5F4A
MGTEARHLVSAAVGAELERAGRSRHWLADRAGIDARRLSEALHGRDDFTVADLAAIAAALDVPVSALTPSADPPHR